MKRLPFLTILLAAAAASGSCGKAIQEDTPLPIRIATTMTKVTDYGFETGDKVGIYIANLPGQLKSRGNHADNICQTLNGAEWVADKRLFWQDTQTKADFYCYFPYKEIDDALLPTKVSVLLDQGTEIGYKASEFLWGKAETVSPTEEPVTIRVRHLMSCLQIILKPGAGWSAEDLECAQVSLCGLMTTGRVNLKSGEIKTFGEPNSILTLKKGGGKFRALVLPQSVKDAELVKIKMGEREYRLKTSIELESGKMHSCTITVNRIGEGLTIGVDPWVNDEQDYGGSVE